MANKKENENIPEDQNPGGVNFNAKEMLLENSEKGTKVKYNERATVKLLKDTLYQKAGKVYSPHRIKAEALVKKGLAEYVK